MNSKQVADILRIELAALDEEPHNPIVFKEAGKDEWCILSFRPFRHDHRPTWREAFDLAYTLSRVRHVVTETTQECSSNEPSTDAQVEAAARSNYRFHNRAWIDFVPDWDHVKAEWKVAYREEARAALEAARDAS